MLIKLGMSYDLNILPSIKRIGLVEYSLGIKPNSDNISFIHQEASLLINKAIYPIIVLTTSYVGIIAKYACKSFLINATAR